MDDPDKADDIEDEDLESWAERHRIQITNPRRNAMPGGSGGNDPRTTSELLDEIDSLQEQIDGLNDTLDSIMDLAGGGPSDDEEDDGDDADGDDDGQ